MSDASVREEVAPSPLSHSRVQPYRLQPVSSRSPSPHHGGGESVPRTSFAYPDDGSSRLPPGCVEVVVRQGEKETVILADAREVARLQAQQAATLRHIREAEKRFTTPDWVRLHPLVGAYLAEAIGSFVWVLTLSLAKSNIHDNPLNAGASTTADMTMLPVGLCLSGCIFALGYISGGHFNPTVSLAVCLAREMSFKMLLSYIAIQLAAAVGAGIIGGLLLNGEGKIFVPTVSSSYSSTGVFSELVFALAMCLVVLHTRYSRQVSNFYYGMAMGMVLSAGTACVGSISGGAFNPAAATGLQAAECFNGSCAALKEFWVYWVAPVAGAAIAAALFANMDTSSLDSPFLLKDENVISVQPLEDENELLHANNTQRRRRTQKRTQHDSASRRPVEEVEMKGFSSANREGSTRQGAEECDVRTDEARPFTDLNQEASEEKAEPTLGVV